MPNREEKVLKELGTLKEEIGKLDKKIQRLEERISFLEKPELVQPPEPISYKEVPEYPEIKEEVPPGFIFSKIFYIINLSLPKL